MSEELGFVVGAHGRLGEELLRVASHIMGKKLGKIKAITVPFMAEAGELAFAASPAPFGKRRSWLQEQIAAAVDQVDSGAGVIIMTDIIGGTAFNVAQQVLSPERGLVLAGVNLPMLLKVPSIRSSPLREAAAELVERSRKAIDCRQPPA